MTATGEYFRLADIVKPRDLIRDVVSDGVRVGISFGFAPEVRKVTSEYKATWSAQKRMWIFDRRQINGQLAAKLSAVRPANLQFDVKAFATAVKEAMANPDPDLFTPYLDVQLFPVLGGGTACLFTYDAVLVSLMQALDGKFLRNRNAWSIQLPIEKVMAALEEYGGVLPSQIYLHTSEISLEQIHSAVEADRPSLSVSGAMPPMMVMGESDEQGTNEIMSVLGSPLEQWPVDEAMLIAATNDYGLYDYQTDGVRHLLRYSSALLADDMGLGKTRQAIVAAHLVGGSGAVLVVSPANLRINWSRQIAMVDPSANIVIDDGDDGSFAAADWLVTNYERLGDMLQRMQKTGVKFRVVVYDEVHYLKELGSSRTRNAFLLSQCIPRQFLLTATPVLNREAELHTLLRLGGHPIGRIPLADFLSEFAGSQEMRQALAVRISEWCLRRQKDVLKDLKGKFVEEIRFALPGLLRCRYDDVLKNDSLTTLVKIGRLRQVLEKAKAEWLISSIQNLGEEDKSIIFCEFADSVKYLAEEFKAAGIDVVTFVGADSMGKKQRAVDRFMTDPAMRVFIGTTKAAGVGIDLPAANYVFFASLPWTDAIKRQAEDRAYRNGQKRKVFVMVPIAENTIDERVLELIKYKAGVERDLLNISAPGSDVVEFDNASLNDEEAEALAINNLASSLHFSGQKAVMTATLQGS